MSTITKGFTKEQLIAKAEEQIKLTRGLNLTLSAKEHVDMCSVLFEIALASLEAEASGRNPVLAYADSYRNMANHGVESIPVWSVITDLERNIAPLFTAPPAPVALPSGYSDFEEIWSSSTHPLTQDDEMKDFAWDIWNACRATMLKSFGNSEQLNSPVIPDCWCRTCRPVTFSDSRFVVCPECGNKRCPHANDHRNACTGSNELGQEGSAYPAAPRQEVK
ncbi:Uncharacterised protein [Enterobacter kobei]|uniref:hypothetical protein n=1 Tax=Enterobacter kobei TaxID=208224 RepID=UPI0007CA1C00|nr:hypothetical protein [Enterobacter kobei]SAZ49310.1 Uncharacterised protein [Enterobacter kobei]